MYAFIGMSKQTAEKILLSQVMDVCGKYVIMTCYYREEDSVQKKT